jgi:glucose/mannose transport system permease protein
MRHAVSQTQALAPQHRKARVSTVSAAIWKSTVARGNWTRERLSLWLPQLVLAPSLAATFIYVFVFTGWTIYISLSNSSLLPTYDYVGFEHYASLWHSRRWNIAYTNLFVFGMLYVLGAMAIGLLLAILIDQRVRGEAVWRTIYLYPLAVSFVVTGTVWSWLFNPTSGIEFFVRGLGWTDFSFSWTTNRNLAIYAIVITGIWQASGFAMALFLAGLRSVDQDLIKAAQIDGAGTVRIYRRVVIPAIGPIFAAVLVVLLQFAIKTFDLALALTGGGPGISTTFPAIYVYDLMFQRGQIAEGAAAAIMILLALAAVLIPYSLWSVWRRRETRHG